MAGIHSTNTKFLVRNFECRGTGTPGELGPLPSTVSVLAHRATGSRVVTAPGLCHWCEPRDVPDSPDIPQWGRHPARALSGVTLAGVPRGSAMTSVLSFNSRDSLGVIRLVRFPGVLILGLSLL